MGRTTGSDARTISRRGALHRIGGIAIGGLGVGLWGARALLGASDADAAGAGPAGIASGAVRCVLAPEQAEGPFYLDDARVRRDVRDGKRGARLALALKVVDASTCKPIRGAAVDIWHCDARGVYSGTSVQRTEDERFLRGIQRTNARGVALFRTIYPGWYPGRTVHVHVIVHVGGNVVHTGQLYFPDSVTDVVHRRSPYSRRPNRHPRNDGDAIYRNGGKRSTLRIKKTRSGYVGSITMGVMRS